MGFNPLEERGISLEKQPRRWEEINVEPYDKDEVHPYTRTRVIMMNGIEVESAIFLHQFARHTGDMELRQELSMVRRMEQQQQKVINWLTPANESTLEVTIGYEQVAVDLTAWLARTEPNPHVKQALDFALLEDFDHLYRYANLLEMDKGIDPGKIVGELTEIMPGRPTIAEHRHPFDSGTRPTDSEAAKMLTNLHILTIVAAEQQTMNFYMNVGNRYPSMVGRGLYQEIAQIEEQHVTHYESLADPKNSWFERLVLHDYNECYLYYSCMETEIHPRIKGIWEQHLEMEIAHLHRDIELMKKYEGRDAREMLPDAFPELVVFQSNKEYVRDILERQVELTKRGPDYVPVEELPAENRFHKYQGLVNEGPVPSQEVVRDHIDQKGEDYRLQTEGEHPIRALQDRKSVSEKVAR
ncbi:MAG: hypothetical protein ACLFU8_12725 [Anaerolineales bacterium]